MTRPRKTDQKAPSTGASTDDDDAELRHRFRHVFQAKALKKLGLLDRFTHADARLRKIDQITEKLLDRAARDGSLARMAAAESPQDHLSITTPVLRTPEDVITDLAKSGGASFVDITDSLINKTHIPSPEENRPAAAQYNVRIPDVPLLAAMPDKHCVAHVIGQTDIYNMRSGNFTEAPELKLLRLDQWPKGLAPPKALITPLSLPFILDHNGMIDESAEKSKKDAIFFYSATQQDFIKTASWVIMAYQQKGQVPLYLREFFMLEQTKEALRTAGYAFSPDYQRFCFGALDHVAAQMKTLQPLTAPQNPPVTPPKTSGKPAKKHSK